MSFNLQPSHYVTITNPNGDMDATDAASKTAQIQQLMGQLQQNLCNVSVMGVPDLDSLSNMDPNSLVDITGKDFLDQLKDSGRLGGRPGSGCLPRFPASSKFHFTLFFCLPFILDFICSSSSLNLTF